MPFINTLIGAIASLLCAAVPGTVLGYLAYLAWVRPDKYMALIRKIPGFDSRQGQRSEEDWIVLGRFGNTLGLLLLIAVVVYQLVSAFR